MPSAVRQETEGRSSYTIAAETAATVTYCPSPEPAQPETETGTIEQMSLAASFPADSKNKSQRFERIATSTSSPEQVIELLRGCAGNGEPSWAGNSLCRATNHN